jgi:hypothetical protein
MLKTNTTIVAWLRDVEKNREDESYVEAKTAAAIIELLYAWNSSQRSVHYYYYCHYYFSVDFFTVPRARLVSPLCTFLSLSDAANTTIESRVFLVCYYFLNDCRSHDRKIKSFLFLLLRTFFYFFVLVTYIYRRLIIIYCNISEIAFAAAFLYTDVITRRAEEEDSVINWLEMKYKYSE